MQFKYLIFIPLVLLLVVIINNIFVLIHEMSHLICGKLSLLFNPSIPIFKFKIKGYRTYSMWYVYLQDHKDDTKIQNKIKYNCLAGYLGELISDFHYFKHPKEFQDNESREYFKENFPEEYKKYEALLNNVDTYKLEKMSK